MYRIFLVEDDPIIAHTVRQHLESWGWQVKAAADFANVMADFTAFDPQLVLLDIGLPVYNGYHWCGEIRKQSRVPVIFLSSASDNMNIVMAMHMGGDDFIPKPFDLNVLTAKVQALLRRTYEGHGGHPVLRRVRAARQLRVQRAPRRHRGGHQAVRLQCGQPHLRGGGVSIRRGM